MVRLLGDRSLVGKNNATSHSKENVRDKHGLIVSKIPVLRDVLCAEDNGVENRSRHKRGNQCLPCMQSQEAYL
ncbi:hypothetical protein SUGI_0987410 [Cryptomeria japonica]|nr:hypothetical protein SUGI_0987410 [Cryptomeria japonica]